LPLVVPVLHVAVVVVPVVLVVIEIGDELAVVVNLALALGRGGRAVIADDIEDELHVALVQLVDERIQHCVRGEQADLLLPVDPPRIDPLEVLRPVAVNRREPPARPRLARKAASARARSTPRSCR
jgi:hypothetical protein